MGAPKRWSLQDAKNKLSEVVDAAARRGRRLSPDGVSRPRSCCPTTTTHGSPPS
jgi:hypothetical protein